MVATAATLLTPVGKVLINEIKRSGAVGIDVFHHTSLYHPMDGYYEHAVILGERGDFLTAPEISPLFGEVVGVWLLDQWIQMGCPQPVQLLELGPGCGTLMADVLRTVQQLRSAFFDNLSVHLVEVSDMLTISQNTALLPFLDKLSGWTRHHSLDTFTPGDGCLFVLANEFFDALPARQYVKTEMGWNERCVTCDQSDHLTFASRSGPKIVNAPADYPVGAIFEDSPMVRDTFARVVDDLKACGGAAFICDYGYDVPSYKEPGFTGDSWQALRSGEPVSPLETPGYCDLSFHVDFGALVKVAQGRGVSPSLMTQADFLNAHGIQERLTVLLEKSSLKQKAHLKGQTLRLTHPLQMGALFKVLTMGVPQKGNHE
jgi:NADH dehydrogenase [ubiquinone] 1 alpha subcomplex assembly factor 7